ncbi:MAG: DUF308 domain-containing protein [Bacteroides sp.]|nr:DUF308 domain-containing protein [Bacteroides sp.]
MKLLKQNGNAIVTCLVEIVTGILLLIDPVGFTAGIIIVVGIGLLLNGLINVIKYFRTDTVEAARQQMLTHGLVSLLAGAFCAFNPNWFIVTFPVIAVIYGVAVLIVGLGKIQITVDMIRLKNNNWFLGAISALVSVICAVVIILNPFASTMVLWIFTGISLILEAVIDAVVLIVNRRKGNKEE